MLIGLLFAVVYTIDFERHFYATPEVETKERAAIDSILGQLESREGHLADSAAVLEETLALYETLLVKSERYDAYLTLRYATNTKDTAAHEAELAFSARVESRDDAIRSELARLAPTRFADFARRRPSLKRYESFFRLLRQINPPVPACDAMQPFVAGWQSDLRDLLLANKTSATREPMAFALIHLARGRNALARLRGFEDAAGEAYAKSGWTRKQVSALLEQVAARADLYKQYQRLRAVPTPDEPRPQFTFDETRALLLDVVRPLGATYTQELARLLDPAERRLDIEPGPNRRRGGFSKGFPGMTSVFYAAGFTGQYNDVRVLAHESTHAVHRELEKHVQPVYASGPPYIFEATAIVNELLLADTLARRATDPDLRRFYLQQFLDGKGLATIFVTAAEGALEQAIYDGVAAGTVRNAGDLDRLTREVFSRYSIVAEDWMEIRLMYEDPFYDVNYAWAGLVALKLFAELQGDPAFAPRYVAMMQNGFDRPADALLRDFTGIDVRDPKLVDDALAVVAPRVEAYHAPD